MKIRIPDIHVTRQMPPTFLLQAENDDVDGVNQSLVYYIALKNAGAPVESEFRNVLTSDAP